MKVSKWKVLGIAGALVLSYAVAGNAVQLKVDENTFADFGFWTKVRYTYYDKTAKSKSAYYKNEFNVKDARFDIEGQVNKLIQFYGEFVANSAVPSQNNVKLEEAGINFAFLPEFQIRFAKGRVPFTRIQATNDYSLIDQLGHWYDPQGVLTHITEEILKSSNGGAVVHGIIPNDVLKIKYSIGIFDTLNRSNQLKDFAWAGRIEFSPPIPGFKAEPSDAVKGWVDESYLGKKGDILTIGLGYYSEINGYTGGKSLDTTGWTIDAFLEKNIGYGIVDAEAGYISLNDSHFYYKGDATKGIWLNNPTYGKAVTKTGDTTMWYAQGQFLYDQVVGIGKPAIYLKYEYVTPDGPKGDFELRTWGVGVNYYIEGNAAKISAGIENASYHESAETYLTSNSLGHNLTNYYVQAQVMF